jgi:hypothetical protein
VRVGGFAGVWEISNINNIFYQNLTRKEATTARKLLLEENRGAESEYLIRYSKSLACEVKKFELSGCRPIS